LKKYLTILYILIACQIGSAQRWAYVLNGNAETLSRINLQTGQIANHIVNTGPVPNQVAYYENNLYVVNSGSASLQIINPGNNQTIAEIQLPINSNPLNVAFADGFAFVSGFLTNRVYKIDLADIQVIDTFTVGQSPAGLIISNGRLYVCNTDFNPVNFTYGLGSLSVVNIADGQEMARISVGKNPQAVIKGPDGVINVICTGDYSATHGSIHFIDPGQLIAVDTINIGGDPFWPVIDDEGRCFISAGGWSGNGIVYCYNALTHQIIKGTGNPIAVGLGAMGLAMDSAGLLYCTAQQANLVSKFDGDGRGLGSFAVGGGPVSIAIIDQRTGIKNAADPAPLEYGFGLPYPNPFNSQVVIPFSGQAESRKFQEIEICDTVGRKIKKIEISGSDKAPNRIIWNGRDESGKMAVTGVYFARLVGTREAVKLVLMK